MDTKTVTEPEAMTEAAIATEAETEPEIEPETVTPERQPALLSSGLSLVELRKHSGRGGITGGATFSSAVDALKANRVRSFLTMLAVIIGVSAVIAVVTLTQGVNESVNASFTGLGTNVLTIQPGASSSGGVRSAAGSSQTLTRADADALAQVPYVMNVSPIIGSNAQVVYENSNWNTRVSGVYPDYQAIQNWQIAEGSWLTDQDEQMGTPVAVIGQTVYQNLFTTTSVDPIGQTIRIGNFPYHIIGVLQTKGSQGTSNADDAIFVPFTAAYKYLNTSPYVNQIQVQVDSTNDITAAERAITTVLRTRHNLSGPDPSLQLTATAARRTSLLGTGGGGAGGGGGGAGGARNGGGGFGGGGAGGSTAARTGTGAGAGAATGTTGQATVSQANDFQIFSVDSLIQSAQQSSTVLTFLLIGIAAISLAVGGIGIMNIMLVSVSERRREIGIRMAIGARRRDISSQFLVEAVMLTAIGGIIGIVLG